MNQFMIINQETDDKQTNEQIDWQIKANRQTS